MLSLSNASSWGERDGRSLPRCINKSELQPNKRQVQSGSWEGDPCFPPAWRGSRRSRALKVAVEALRRFWCCLQRAALRLNLEVPTLPFVLLALVWSPPRVTAMLYGRTRQMRPSSQGQITPLAHAPRVAISHGACARALQSPSDMCGERAVER